MGRQLLLRSLFLCICSLGLGPLVATALPRVTPDETAQGFSHRAILAKPRATAQAPALAAAESRDGARLRRSFPRLGHLRVIEPAPGESVTQAISRLRATGLYEFVEPDYLRQPQALPDDPRFIAGEQWYLHNTGQEGGTPGADIDAAAGWDVRTGAPELIVAIIDSGIRTTHEDLAPNLWINPGEIPGNGLDDDGNGYVDDVHGINSLAALGSPGSGDPEDDSGHGTSMAGLVAAAGNNGRGLAGVAWQAKIMALKFDDKARSATVSNVVECLDYAIAHGARIVNISYTGFWYSQSEYEAIARARAAGVIVVTSAGNFSLSTDLVPGYPGSYLLDNVVCVAATDRHDALAGFSNHSQGVVDLAAPGAAIVSTNFEGDSAYSTHDGTSMSAPMVAGALALLAAQFPDDDYRGLINRLLRSTERLPSLAGKAQTAGRLNLARALATTSPRPFNDDFADRAFLDEFGLTVRTHNRHATLESGEPLHDGIETGATLWWSWKAPLTGRVIIETAGSDFDTVAAVYTGDTLDTLTRLAANDDALPGLTHSRVAFDAVANRLYHFAVGGKNAAAGSLLLSIGYPPENDQFAAATALTGRSLRESGFNSASSSETGEPKADPAAGGRSVWFKWTATTNSDFVSFSVFAYGFDAVGAVYTGSSLDTLQLVDTASTEDYNEPAVFETTLGTTYYFQVDTLDRQTGYFEIVLVDAFPFPGYTPNNPSPAFSPVTRTLASANVDGTMFFYNFATDHRHYDFLAGTLEVGSPAFGPDGAIYIGDEWGVLYCFNPDFSLRWFKVLGLARVTSSPAIGADGAVYVHTDDGRLHAYFPDGTRKWRVSVPGDSYSSVSIGGDGTLYLGSTDQHLYALSPTDGALKWKFKADGEVIASPAIDAAGALYFGTLNGKFYSVNSSGALRWTFIAGGSISSSAALGTDGSVYFGCYDTYLYALNASGQLRWKYKTGDEIRASSPAVAANGNIYIGSYDGFVHAVSSIGLRRRVYATGAYIRSSPLIHDGALFIGSGDGRLYLAEIDSNLAQSPWPMHRQNVQRTGRRPSTTAPRILGAPVATAVTSGNIATLAVNADGADTLAFQWLHNGTPIEGATRSTLVIDSFSPGETGDYAVVITNSLGSVTSTPVVLGLTSTNKTTGAALALDPPDIRHPNGNTFDQVLLTGIAGAITADYSPDPSLNQITRLSFIDLDDDIVQIEFSGPGTLSLVLQDPSGPAAPLRYHQPAVAYMKGRAGIVITGATEQTNVSVFTVGRATAFDPTGAFNLLLAPSDTNRPANNGSPLFQGHRDTVYDGRADIAFISIASANGRFGGVRTANARYSAANGFAGVYAPGVAFNGPVFIADIDASGDATPAIILGTATDVRITGGDLLQSNNRPVQVSGISQLKFTGGGDSHGTIFTAQTNRAVLQQNGTDVTQQLVTYPTP